MFEGTRNSLLLGMSLLAGLASAPAAWAQGPTPGQNVNMVSGTKWPGGDPFLQRQNEPSIAVSTRNPQHLLAGANDYRTVDLNLVDQLPINQLSGDAWLGVFKSFDGGQRWQSTLLPGFPQDRSTFGASSPMKGFGAASDPVVRAGTNGMFYYSGIALNRGTNVGALFLSRFIDLNNKENGDATQSNYPSPTTDPIRYIDTVEIDSGNAGQFIDKPWIAVDIPRAGAGTCTIQVPQDNDTSVTQSFPAGNVYMAYAMFVGGTINVRSKIKFTKSSDCGHTWTKPIMISQTYDTSQGTQVAVDPETGYVYVAWRTFSGSGNDPDAMVITKSTDGGNTFTKAVSVRSLSPFNAATPTSSASFDQNTSGTEFRTQSMPTIAVDDSGTSGTPGNVYVAWSERGVPPTGDARIMISTSRDGTTWSAPMPVDNNPITDDVGDQFTRGHQLMPAMTFTGGKLMLVYYDLRLDHTTGRFTPNTPFGPDNKGQFFEEGRPYLGDDRTKVFTPFVDDAGLAVRRHTIEVNVAQSNGGLTPSFTTARLSRYDFGQPGPDPSVLQLQQLEQLKVNPPNLPMFSQGTVPFMGDYLDVTGLMFVPLPGGGWTFNNPAPSTATASSAAAKPPLGSPVYYGSWTSNQDVIPPADGDWTKYSAVPLPSQTASIFNGQPLPPCAAGWESDRNQNIYESRITQGLLVSSPQNSKPLSTTLQRAFVILVQNSTNFQKTFQLSIANQPPGNFSITGQNSPGGFASFRQAVPNQPSLPNPLPAPVTIEFAAIPAHSGAPRTLFALSSNPTASITVNVNEVDSAGKVVSGGLSSFIVLNADGTVPPLTNPDGAPTGTSIAGVEIYDPNITAPNITAPNITAPNITAPNITAPNITAPNITAPNITAPNITAPNITATSVANPNITAPNITAGSIADATYTVTNTGNTTMSYHVKLAGGAGGANAKVPLQLTVNQIYTTPASYQCQLIPQQQNITSVNVLNPEFTPLNQLSNPNITAADPSDATIYLAPGDSALITLRGQTDVATMQSIVTQIAPVVVPHAVNTNSVATTPTFAAPPFITTASLPNGVTGVPYSAPLQAIGGTAPYTWSVRLGSLPGGLTLNPSTGVVSGTPTVSNLPGTSITFQAQDSTGLAVTRNLTIAVASPPLAFTASTVPTALVGKPYTQALPVLGGTLPYNATVTSGTLPPGLGLSSGGVLNGTPSGTGSFTFTVTVTDSSTPAQTATQTFTMGVNTLVISTTVLPNGIVGVPYSAAIATVGGTLPLSFSLANTAFPPGLLIQQPAPFSSSGALAGTPTLAGTYTFIESVVDHGNPAQTATQNYVVTIAPFGTPAPANVTFVSQPQNSVGGQTLGGSPVVVRVTDATNNPIPGTTVAMTLSGFFGGPLPCSAATLNGTLTAVTDASGRALFSNLSVDRGAFNYGLVASTGSATQFSGPFSVQGFCASANLLTQREEHTQVLLGTPQSTTKFPVDPKGAYIFTNTNPGPSGAPDVPNAPLIIPLASLGLGPGDVLSGISVGDVAFCPVGSSCFGEIFNAPVCGLFSSSNTLLPTGGTINRVPGAIAPDFTTAFPCNTPPTLFGNLPTDIPQDFGLFGERVTVPPGAAYLFVAVSDSFYSDNSDPNGDFGVAITVNKITVNTPSPVNGKVLIAGGIDNLNNVLNTAELYDPALGFTSPTGFLTDPNGRFVHNTVVLDDGRVLLIGGASNISNLATAELYDPLTGKFTATAGSMAEPRYYAAAVRLADGRVLVTGGFDTSVAKNTAEIYNPATDSFTPTGNMNQRRGRHAMTLLPNGKVLVTGGRDSQQNFFALASAEIFDPFANQGVGAFTPTGDMNSPRHVHTATLLSNGTVLVAGGFTGGAGSSSSPSAETFDPSTNVFTPTGNMNTPRSRHTSTLLPDGSVLESGGVDRFQGIIVTAPAELYSPTSRAFSPTGPQTTGREFHRTTVLPNGNALLSGGDDGINVLASTELYFNPVAQAPIVITTASVPNGFISQHYVQLLLEQGSSGPITWSLASGALPPGITLGANGILSGTPTAVGSFTFTVQLTDGISRATASFTINVSLVPLAFTSNTMPAAGAGKPYSQPLPITGGTQPYNATVTSGTLPPGLALSSTGILSGTPSGVGSFTFTATVTDSSTPVQTATQTMTIAVDTLFITTTALPSGMVGTPYNAAISTSGGALPLTFSPATSAFPPGLAIQQPAANSHSGALAGTPTQAGHFTFTESVVDSSNPAQTATQYYLMDIFEAGTTAAPATVTFLSQPQNSIGGQILTGSPIRVHVTDANNAPIPGASVAISFNGAPPCSSAVLSGTLNGFTNGNGNAVFFDLSIDRGQLGYTLLASAGSASAVSQPFNVNGSCPTATTIVPAGSHILFIIQPPGPMGGGSTGLQAVVQLFDASNSPIAGAELAASFGAKPCPAAALSGSLTAVTDANGLAAFSGITSNRGGQGYTGVATATSNPSVSATSNPFSIRGFCETGSLNLARANHAVIALPNGKVLVAGGTSDPSGAGTVFSSAELYDPATHSFTTISGSGMKVPREAFTMTQLPNGKVLIAGGVSTIVPGSNSQLSSAELFDPSTNSFTLLTASMTTLRAGHAAVALPNGKVLITGGDAVSATKLQTAEIFDPATNTFTATRGVMNAQRENHHSDLLPDGTVLISGGTDFNVNPLSSAELYDPVADTFTPTKGSMATARARHASALLFNGKVLVAGGNTGISTALTPTATAEVYDPSTGLFSLTGSMTRPRAQYFSTVLGDGKVFIADGTADGRAEMYDPAAGIFQSAGRLALPQFGEAQALLPDGTVLLTGGSNGSTTVTNAEIFYPTNPPFLVQEFTTTGNLNTARNFHTATLLSNGRVLVAGGVGSGVSLASADLYDPATGTFTATGSMNTGREYHTATPLSNGLVLIVGGAFGVLASAELYNPATGIFTATGNLNTARFLHTASLLNNGLVLIVGGFGSFGGSLASAELYNPVTGTFTATGSLNTARASHTATLLNNGLVLIAGGIDSSGNVSAGAELYNPATGTFTATGSMNTPRLNYTATLLSNGLVLIAGGDSSLGTLLPLASAELYNPATGTFTATGSLNTTRLNHTATLLNNGLVLIAAGFGSSGVSLAGELYNPATGAFTATDSLNTGREHHTATLLPTGKVLVAGGDGNNAVLATSELYQYGTIQQLQPQSCSYEGHIKSIGAFSTPTAVRFVNNSTTATFKVFWLDYNGSRVPYATLGPGQSYVQQTFLTHPWVIADISPAATCQEIYLPLPEQAPAIFPPGL